MGQYFAGDVLGCRAILIVMFKPPSQAAFLFLLIQFAISMNIFNKQVEYLDVEFNPVERDSLAIQTS